MKGSTEQMHERDKIAIVGIGCRYAGGINDVSTFWETLKQGLDCTGPIPDSRYDMSHFYHPNLKQPGKLYNKRGGYLSQDVFSFDRQFFKISPEEANHLDPQVRLLLEVTWESFEDAGIPLDKIKGSNTGCYMGVTAHEYVVLTSSPVSNFSQYTNSGTNSCMIANRISYEFDFRGPSFTIDTACSSSLYAVHLACEGIRSGQCNMAVAGGVNLVLLPLTSIGFCQAGMLAPDGRCKSFDASADGYARGEGAGSIVLKKLDEAVADGNRIYGVIRGGALSNDGHTPGIANPSLAAQKDLIRKACQNSAISPADLLYIEAHGTGTQVGDVTEATALGEIVGRLKIGGNRLYIGSVKSNIGHCEGSAGVAGIIKTALMLKNRAIPPVANFKTGNPQIDFNGLNLIVPKDYVQWKSRHLVAGCSSFGFGGANANLILEQCTLNKPSNPAPAQKTESCRMLLLSAKSKEALIAKVAKWTEFLSSATKDDFYDILTTAALCFDHHKHRLAVPGKSLSDVYNSLKLFLQNPNSTQVTIGDSNKLGQHQNVVFIFNGMGTQWYGMGRNLIQNEPTFQNSIQNFDKFLVKCGAKWSLYQLLVYNADKNLINETEYAQPAICAIQVALVDTLEHYGITPSQVIGHSVGEVAASYAAGMLNFEETVRVIYHRSRSLRKTSGSGSMLAVMRGKDEVQKDLEASGLDKQLDIAAVNSPSQVVLSGPTDCIATFQSRMQDLRMRCVLLKVNNAFHSRQQEVLKSELMKGFMFLTKSRRPTKAILPMVSSITGSYVPRKVVRTPEYWWRNTRQEVKFMAAIQCLIQNINPYFIEIGSHQVLHVPVMETVASISTTSGSSPSTIGTLQKPHLLSDKDQDTKYLMKTLAQLYCDGYSLDLCRMFPNKFERQSLPTYPWQRVVCSATTSIAREIYTFPMTYHPLLGVDSVAPFYADSRYKLRTQAHITPLTAPWVSDHVVQNSVVVPATAYLEIGLSAAKMLSPNQHYLTLFDFHFKKFLFAPANSAFVQSTVEEKAEGFVFCLHSLDASGKQTEHARGKIAFQETEHDMNVSNAAILSVEKIIGMCDQKILMVDFYRNVKEAGFALGPSFQGIQSYSYSNCGRHALSVVETTEEVFKEFQRYTFHPAMLDTVLQTSVFCPTQKNTFHVPYRIRECSLYGKVPVKFYVYGHSYKLNGKTVYDISAAEYTSRVIFLNIKELQTKHIGRSNQIVNDFTFWNLTWKEQPLSKTSSEYIDGKKLKIITNGSVVAPWVREIEAALKQSQNVVVVTASDVEDVLNLLKQGTDIMIAFGETYSNSQASTFDDLIRANILFALKIARKLMNFTFKIKLWLVTQSSRPSGSFELAMSVRQAINSIGVSLVHETDTLRVNMIDIPSELPTGTSIKDIANSFAALPDDENEFLYQVDSQSSEIKCHVRRVITSTRLSCLQAYDGSNRELLFDDKGLLQVGKHISNKEQPNFTVDAFLPLNLASQDEKDAFMGLVYGRSDLTQGLCVVNGSSFHLQIALPQDKLAPLSDAWDPVQVLNSIYALLPVATAFVNGVFPVEGDVLLQDDNTFGIATHHALKSMCNSVDQLSETRVVGALPKDRYDCVFIFRLDQVEDVRNSIKPGGTLVVLSLNTCTVNVPNVKLLTIDMLALVCSPLFDEVISKAIHILKNTEEFNCKASYTPLSEAIGRPMCSLLNTCIVVDRQSLRLPLELDGNNFKPTPRSTYIVTGGSRGIGLAIVQWLQSKGVQNIVILSRTKPPESTTRQLNGENDVIHHFEVDVSDSKGVEAALKLIQANLLPVEGIIHCAAVFSDGLMCSTSDEEWMKVLKPKAFGAQLLHLHSQLLGLPLKHFVMISSLVSYIGNVGQANYCAANSYLNSLAESRQSRGLPAVSIGFGIISGTGFAARNDIVKLWEKKGLYSMTPEDVLRALDTCITQSQPHIGVSMGFDGELFVANSKGLVNYHFQCTTGSISRLKTILPSVWVSKANETLGNMMESEALLFIEESLVGQLAEVLGYPKDAMLSDNVNPVNMGLDSLLASELSNYIEKTFAVTMLPVEILNDTNTIKTLVRSIFEKSGCKVEDNKDYSSQSVTNQEEGSRWFKTEESILEFKTQLICFPPLGGGMSNFAGWQDVLGRHGIKVYVVELPGWEGRHTESPLNELGEIVKGVSTSLKEILNEGRFIFYGHSFGALVAFETAHYLKDTHGLSPNHLYIGAWYCPAMSYKNPRKHSMTMFHPDTPIEVAVKGARLFKIFDESTLNNDKVMKRVLPCLRTGVNMCTEYRLKHGKFIGLLTTFVGNDDGFATPCKVKGWIKMVADVSNYKIVKVQGGHMFIAENESRDIVLETIASDNFTWL